MAGQYLDDDRDATSALLEALAAHGALADVFVEGRRVEVDGEAEARRDLLRRWRDTGHALQNHGYSHLRYSKTDTPKYLEDTERGYRVVTDLLAEATSHGSVRFFRAPLHDLGKIPAPRTISEKRRVGTECVSTCR